MAQASVAPPALLPGVAAPSPRGGYIVGPAYDYAFFILSPLLALVMGLWLFDVPEWNPVVSLPRLRPGWGKPLLFLFQSTFTHAHLLAVFYRSHGNRAIFRLHPLRFVVVPLLLIGATWLSDWAYVVAYVVGVWWDIYHTAAQTFGLSRIYDARAGNDPRAGRGLELALQVVLYAGPLVCGLSFATHLGSFTQFKIVGAEWLVELAPRIFARWAALRLAVLVLGAAVVLAAVRHYREALRAGYRVPAPKAALLVSSTICSLVAWTFMVPAEALFVVNFFHALQYFAIVWWSEGGHLLRSLRLDGVPGGRALALLALLVPTLSYGFVAVVQPEAIGKAIAAIAVSVSLLHFWYDGFIWSVRKQQV